MEVEGVQLDTASDAALIQLLLHPQLAAALEKGTPLTPRSIATPLVPSAWSLPVLSPAATAAIGRELSSALPARRHALQPHADAPPCAVAAVTARLLRQRVLPALSRALLREATPLCAGSAAYLLRYSAGGADGGRVHRCHVDDSDVSLAVCIGAADGRAWRGADLVYVHSEAEGAARPRRPGTPDLAAEGTRTVCHTHVSGVGVLHGGEVYHYVTPLTSGERGTLVLQAFWDDRPWKRTFYTRAAATS